MAFNQNLLHQLVKMMIIGVSTILILYVGWKSFSYFTKDKSLEEHSKPNNENTIENNDNNEAFDSELDKKMPDIFDKISKNEDGKIKENDSTAKEENVKNMPDPKSEDFKDSKNGSNDHLDKDITDYNKKGEKVDIEIDKNASQDDMNTDHDKKNYDSLYEDKQNKEKNEDIASIDGNNSENDREKINGNDHIKNNENTKEDEIFKGKSDDTVRDLDDIIPVIDSKKDNNIKGAGNFDKQEKKQENNDLKSFDDNNEQLNTDKNPIENDLNDKKIPDIVDFYDLMLNQDIQKLSTDEKSNFKFYIKYIIMIFNTFYFFDDQDDYYIEIFTDEFKLKDLLVVNSEERKQHCREIVDFYLKKLQETNPDNFSIENYVLVNSYISNSFSKILYVVFSYIVFLRNQNESIVTIKNENLIELCIFFNTFSARKIYIDINKKYTLQYFTNSKENICISLLSN
ncbi:hypothetical protein GVAV_001865 [Gurleya vavrai]